MKTKMAVLLLLLLFVTNLFAVKIETMDDQFQKHAVLGGALTGVGFRVAGVFLDRTTEQSWVDRRGNVHMEYRIEENPDHLIWKIGAGLALNAIVIYVTDQEYEDQNAMYCGCVFWSAGELLYRAIKMHLWQ